MASCRKCLNAALAESGIAPRQQPIKLRARVRRQFPRVQASEAMIINLNQYRKKRRRTEAETQAKENRIRFGRSKEERTAELRERERAKREMENKRLD
jgi:Domain of unknown function (DUF4169)